MEPDNRPLCPKCGCPARSVLTRATLELELKLSGKAGRILGASDQDTKDCIYQCGGGHRWKIYR